MKTDLLRMPIRALIFAVILAMLVGLLPAFPQEAAAADLQNPRRDGSTVTWDCVWFGHYPQSSDGNGSFSNDRIKWRVLSVNGGEALLLADRNLDVKQYNETNTDVSWGTSTIRSWLNGYGSSSNVAKKDYTSGNFIDQAFTSAEQGAIRPKTIQNPDNPGYGTEGGNNTTDKIFLLSIDEVTRLAYGFSGDSDEHAATREALHTAYTASKDSMGAEGVSDFWWLRSPGCGSNFAANVYNNGYVHHYGIYAGADDYAVRPALSLKLSSDLWSHAGTVSGEDTGRKGQNLANFTIGGIKRSYTYTGKAIKPAVTVSGLKEGTDYIVTYRNNVTVGTATLKVTGKGGYYGVQEKTFAITKGKQNILAKSCTKIYGSKSFNLNARAEGKLSYKSGNRSVASVSSTGRVTPKAYGKATITITAAATKNCLSAVRKITVTVKPSTGTITGLKAGSREFTVKAGAKKGGVKYQYCYKEKGKKTYKSCYTTKNYVTIRKLKKGKIYNVKVRAYKKTASGTVYGSFSKVKSIRVN